MIGILFTGGEGPDALSLERYLEWLDVFNRTVKQYSRLRFNSTVKQEPDDVFNSTVKQPRSVGKDSCVKHNIIPPLVIAADSGAMLALDCGFLPDAVVGDMDSIPEATLNELDNRNVELITHPRDKDFSDSELGLRILRERGAQIVLMAGGGGGRLDHLAALLRGLEHEDAPDVWLTARDIIYRVDGPIHFTVIPGSELSCFPLGRGELPVETEGLKWELGGLNLDNSRFSLSNRCESGQFLIAPQNVSGATAAVAVIADQTSKLRPVG